MRLKRGVLFRNQKDWLYMAKRVEKQQLPAVTASTFGEMFVNGSRRRNDLKKLFPSIQTKAEVEEQSLKAARDARKKSEYHPFNIWKQAYHLSSEEMARRLSMSIERYERVEDDEVRATFEEWRRFCHSFKIHPIEVLDFDYNLVEDELHLALDALKNPASYHYSTELCHGTLYRQLQEYVDGDVSRHVLDGHHETLCTEAEDNEDQNLLRAVLLGLIVNDGHGALAKMGVVDFIDMYMSRAKERAMKCAIDIQNKLDDLSVIADMANERGVIFFGEDKWREYQQFVLKSLDSDEFGADPVKRRHPVRDIYCHSLPTKKAGVTHDQLLEHFGLLVSIFEKQKEHTDLDEKGALIAWQIEAVEDFAEVYEEILLSYQGRQMVLANTQFGDADGEPYHPLYLPTDIRPQFKKQSLQNLIP